MILCDDTPVCPSVYSIHEQMLAYVDDTARPDPVQPAPPQPKPTDIPSWITSFASCVIDHESRDWPYDGHPRPYAAHRSDGGTASGAYQFIDSTWRSQSRLAGLAGYSRAMLAPPAVQDAVFAFVVSNGGAGNWNGTHCGYGT